MQNMSTRTVTDTLGSIDISHDALWDIHTQRALKYFNIGHDIMPECIIRNYLLLKKAATQTNRELGVLSSKKAKLILDAIKKCLAMGPELMDHFPLHVWQTGSGAHTHMNINEVIAGIINKEHPGVIDTFLDINASQSTNDTFSTVMHITTAQQCIHVLMPEISRLRTSFAKLETRYALTIKIGRTHLQDALPITYGQVFAGYQQLLTDSMNYLHQSLDNLFELAIGGTSVGTGFGAPHDFDNVVCQHLSDLFKLPFIASKNKCASISAHSAMLHFMGCLVNLACSLNKIARDISLLASGPHCGIGEILLPENELGSSTMPGKVNPSQCEALSMVCHHVIGQYNSVAMGCANGQMELNAYKPLIIFNVLKSLELLSDGIQHFEKYCIRGIMVHEGNTRRHLEASLMLVTALVQDIGYTKASEVAHKALNDNVSIKEATLQLGYITAERLDQLLDPATMIGTSEPDDYPDI